MGISTLTVELASEGAWRAYALMNPAAAERNGLKADLDEYLSKMEKADTSQDLTVVGLRYLKLVGGLEGRQFRKQKLASL
jgi:hypothetical protein